MDVHGFMIYIITFYLLITTKADGLATKDTTLRSADSSKTCTSTYNMCKLKLGDIDFMTKPALEGTMGPKGETGRPGLMGRRGETGDPGPMGPRGETGDPGPMGLRGATGDPGPMGPRGETGDPGPMGPRGQTGYAGLMGIKGETGDPGTMGPKGETGFPGLMGLKGEAGFPGPGGTKGEIGNPGPMGPKGESGFPGPGGPKGEIGNPGPMGLKEETGFPGPEGPKGETGFPGLMGPKGEKGSTGPQGEVGPNGLPGICPCMLPGDDFDSAETVGTKDNPLTVPCKSASIADGIYQMYKPTFFQVECVGKKITCINETTSQLEYKNKAKEEPLWWSRSGTIDTTKLYGITKEHISWLQQRSVSAVQQLRIYYKHFKPSFDREGATIHLLSWNDIIVKPYTTPTTPFFYTVTSRNDDCHVNLEKWCSVDIQMSTEPSIRLPIIDVLIHAPEGKDIEMKLENIKLCYG